MKKTIFILSMLLSALVYSQDYDAKDYEVLNAVLYDLTFSKGNDTIRMYENPYAFNGQKEFFTKDNLVDYTFPTAGVDSKRVKKLIPKLKFEYLANQKRSSTNWEKSKFSINVEIYQDNKTNRLNQKKQFIISKPIYTKDLQFVFIHYLESCGYYDCTATVVKVYRKCKKGWEFYVQFPISMS